MSKSTEFKRIVRQIRLGGSNSIWESASHLLLVRNNVLSESYRRFYYRDIQAIQVELNHYRMFTAIAIGLLLLPAAGMLALAALRDWHPAAVTAWAVLTGFLFAPFLINFLRGRCCKCYIQTSVQRDLLEPVNRLRDAHRVIDRLRPLIESAQGVLDPEQLSDYVAELPADPPRAPRPPPQPLRVIKATFHKAVFLLLLVGAASSLGMLAFPNENRAIAIVVAVLILASFICNLGALITQYRSTLPRGLRTLTWIALAYLCTGVLVTWILSVVHAFRTTLWSEAESLLYDPVYSAILLADGLISATLGVVGLLMLRRHARESTTPPSPTTPVTPVVEEAGDTMHEPAP